jgi:putative ABC transport system substrate-binding protein
VKAATTTTPIVFFMGDDPVARGLVASFAQPGGNVTGVSWLDVELMPKRLDLMMELVPRATAIGLLVNPKSPNVARVVSDMQKASRVKGVELLLLKASTEGEIEAASATLRRVRVGGLIVSPDPFFLTHRTRLVALAAQRAVPAVYDRREYANAGGLISYGASLAVGLRQLGVYTGKILTGTRPAELPVVQPTAFELVINSKTANALGLALPQSLILRAEQVIG